LFDHLQTVGVVILLMDQKKNSILENKFTDYHYYKMRDHTPDFKLHELSSDNKLLIRQTVQQLFDKLSGDGKLTTDTLLEFWIEVPGVQRSRGTFRGGFLMPDSFIFIADYFQPDVHSLTPSSDYVATGATIEEIWDDLLDELFYQIEIFTSPVLPAKGVMLELWAGNRHRPEGEWIYAVDRKVELR